MTSLFPHPTYAEEQPSSRPILYLHTIRAGLATGTIISLITSSLSLLASRYRHPTNYPRSLRGLFSAPTLLPRLLTHSARGVVLGSIFGAVATWGRMLGREEIEWQDRSWRLLENKGQVEVDWWILDGGVLGAAVGLAGMRRGRIPAGMGMGRVVLGTAGLGVNAGVVGYMAWRYGVKGGKFE